MYGAFFAIIFLCREFAVIMDACKRKIYRIRKAGHVKGKIKQTTFSLMLQLMTLIPRIIATSESHVSGLSTPAPPSRRRKILKSSNYSKL